MKEKKKNKSSKKIFALGTVAGIVKVVCPDCNAVAERGTLVMEKPDGKMYLQSGWKCPKCSKIFRED